MEKSYAKEYIKPAMEVIGLDAAAQLCNASGTTIPGMQDNDWE